MCARFLLRSNIALLGVCLVLSGCADLGEPELGSPPDSVSSAGTAPADGSSGQGSATTPTPQLPPPRPEGYVPALIVSTEQGVAIIREDAEPQLLILPTEQDPDAETDTETDPIQTSALSAIDDFFRGLVVQYETGIIDWFQVEGGAARRVNSAGDKLLDVGFSNGTTEAIVLANSSISRIRLADSQRSALVALQADEELLDFSAGGGLYATVVADTECGKLTFVNAAGEPVPVSVPTAPPCETARRPLYGSVAVSVDGSAVAYTQIEYRADGVEAQTTLFVVDLSTGAIVTEVQAGSSGDLVSGLTFDGQRVAFVREPASAESEVVLLTDDEPTVVQMPPELGIPQSVSWSRLPVAVGSS